MNVRALKVSFDYQTLFMLQSGREPVSIYPKWLCHPGLPASVWSVALPHCMLIPRRRPPTSLHSTLLE